jgi:hypothetical protein
MAITNKEINLAQLTKELNGKGLIADFNDPLKKIINSAEGVNLSEFELETAIENHVAEPEIDHKAARDSALAKLAALGLTADEIAAL